MNLVTKFWNFCHTLRHEGIDYNDYIEELTCLIFLKIAEEKGVTIPKDCNWDYLVKVEEKDLLKKYNQILTRLSKQPDILGDIFKHPIAKIRNTSSLKKLLLLIDGEKWSDYNEDILGAMFEGLLEKAATGSKKGAGQYFTPRPLIEAIVAVMKPNPFETSKFKIADVACGTAGFLITSFEWAKNHIVANSLTQKEKNKLLQNTYYGQELVVRPRRMAQMNLFLHGLSSNILLGDTIYEPLKSDKFHCVLTNPPFGTKGANQIPDRSDFKIKTSNKQLNFIQHVYSCLLNKGRAAIVLPDNVLFEDKASDLWRYLMKLCNVHTILKLPKGTFLPYANVQANVIFLQKGLPTTNIWIYDARKNIATISAKGRPLTANHFKAFIKAYGADPNGLSERTENNNEDRFRMISIGDIEKRKYNLDFTWIDKAKNDKNNSNKISTENIIREAIEQANSMANGLKKLLVILEN